MLHFSGLVFRNVLVFIVSITGSTGSVRIVEDDLTGSLLTVEQSSFFLTCEYIHNSSVKPQFVFWRNGEPVSGFVTDETTRDVNTETSSTLFRIIKSDFTLNDGGMYSCAVGGKTANVTIRVIKQDKKFEQSYRHTEDERVEIVCPIPSAITANTTWYKDGNLLDGTTTVSGDSGNHRNGKLMFPMVQRDDKGVYVCVASMSVATKPYTTRLRVIDKLAPLWPFLGIVLEILVLAGIIFGGNRFCKKVNQPTEPALKTQ